MNFVVMRAIAVVGHETFCYNIFVNILFLEHLALLVVDELSPSVTLCNIIVSENIGDVTTPTKLLGYEPVLPVTSKRKSIMSKLSCRRGLPSKPFDISGSPWYGVVVITDFCMYITSYVMLAL